MYNMGWCAKVAKSMCPCQDAWDAEEKPLFFSGLPLHFIAFCAVGCYPFTILTTYS